MVLSQKAYILFYIRKPTNGHAVPAELAQHAQQLSKGLNGLQAAASHSKQPDAPAVFGPAQRPAPGLLAAKRLHDELLAPAAQARNTRQVNATNSTAPPAAETSTCTNTHPTRSTDQLPSLGGVSLRDHGASNQQTRRQAQAPAEEGQEGLKLAAKRKADLLGSGKRPSMMQKMSAAGIDATAAADPTTEQPPKRKKHSADPPAAAAASSAAAAAAATTVAADEDPAVGQSAEPTDDLAVGSTSRVHQSDHAEHAVPAVDAEGLERHVARGVGGSDRYASKQRRSEGTSVSVAVVQR